MTRRESQNKASQRWKDKNLAKKRARDAAYSKKRRFYEKAPYYHILAELRKNPTDRETSWTRSPREQSSYSPETDASVPASSS